MRCAGRKRYGGLQQSHCHANQLDETEMNARKRQFVEALLVLELVAPLTANASGGNYDIQGGTLVEQGQIYGALNESSFDWSVVPTRIHFHVSAGSGSYARPGEIWIDANLLDAGRFSWGVIDHEYAHQVDFFRFSEAGRAELRGLLGGQAWWERNGSAIPHFELASERFASTLAWSYWPSPDNAMRPSGPGDESGAMAPAAFRALIDGMLGRRPASPSAPPPDVTPNTLVPRSNAGRSATRVHARIIKRDIPGDWPSLRS
jgi:hypothetical protein